MHVNEWEHDLSKNEINERVWVKWDQVNRNDYNEVELWSVSDWVFANVNGINMYFKQDLYIRVSFACVVRCKYLYLITNIMAKALWWVWCYISPWK